MTLIIKQEFNISSTKNAQTLYCDDGSEILQSYDTQIVRRYPDGILHRLWDSMSNTTARHIKTFCGLNAKQYRMLPKGKRWEEDDESIF